MANKLIFETSPYLLQHAHNPVDWYPWGDEALQLAKELDKPILISIGYAACHWCHVMERESFEDEKIAAEMNMRFINIKIDREERPDLDHIYMDAMQAIAGNGGWPLHVFLTPDAKPFYGGTYFPPRPFANRPSWQQVLINISEAYKNRREEVEQAANSLFYHLKNISTNFSNSISLATVMDISLMKDACINLLRQADTTWGGFGSAPKFPQTNSIQFLLKYYHFEKNKPDTNAEAALQQALLSIDKMIEGGIYDHVGGGFARYATDKEWLVPHFEKMLYDNALLVGVLCDAYQITKRERYKEVIEQTFSFVQREMLHQLGGFYAALDADSEGVEGKYYVWSYDELAQILGDDVQLFCDYYGVKMEGNWEGVNILHTPKPIMIVAEKYQLDSHVMKIKMDTCRNSLMQARNLRVRPGLDDKVILGWNALMNIAYSKAYAALGKETYKQRAIENMEFLLRNFTANDGLHHVWKNGVAKYPAFLDDYAYLIKALLQLHTITANTDWLLTAKKYAALVVDLFSDDESILFYYTPNFQQDVIVRKMDTYDGATPSGNAVMAQNLLELGLYYDESIWIVRSHNMVQTLSNAIAKHPTAYGAWLNCLYQHLMGSKEIVLIGNYRDSLKQLLSLYLPHTIVMASEKGSDDFPLLKNRTSGNPVNIYVCENYTCNAPVSSIAEINVL